MAAQQTTEEGNRPEHFAGERVRREEGGGAYGGRSLTSSSSSLSSEPLSSSSESASFMFESVRRPPLGFSFFTIGLEGTPSTRTSLPSSPTTILDWRWDEGGGGGEGDERQ